MSALGQNPYPRLGIFRTRYYFSALKVLFQSRTAGHALCVKSVDLMYPLCPTKPIMLINSMLSANFLLAQPALEMASGGGPTTNGSSVANQTVTFQNNTNNPTGNT